MNKFIGSNLYKYIYRYLNNDYDTFAERRDGLQLAVIWKYTF